MCRVTERRPGLSLLVITHEVADMVSEVRFATRGYAFLFIAHMLVAAKNLQAKARIWYKTLRGSVCPSMAEHSQLLSIDIGPYHVDWVIK